MNKIERLKRIAAALTLASSVAFTTGCSYSEAPKIEIEVQDNHDLPKINKLTDEDKKDIPNHIDECIKYQVNGEDIKIAYKRENIMIVYNELTNDYIKLLKYNYNILDEGILIDNEYKYVQYYDLTNHELLVNYCYEHSNGIIPDRNFNIDFYFAITKENSWKTITFDQLEDYTTEGELKDSYTEEQIDAIAQSLIDVAKSVKTKSVK